MTPQEHNKYVAFSHLAYGSLMALFSLFFIGMFWGMFASIPNGPPSGFLVAMSLFITVIYGLMIVPSLIAGYGLLKKKKWARTAAIIGAVTAAMNFPLGTAACVYTFWFLFSEPGKAMFENTNFRLPPNRQEWANEAHYQQQQNEYAPPPTPPDWR
ncbi:MAG TPA: hypothetical protein VGQ39_16555 [Pyrinomonadaceae bacterium]|nr:hypothetical protein [Pyrinomonadaceae bacterium]